ncbi:MAG: acyltransferase, partial [Actinomycetales bacterium]|nr:acyltransferase [Actinomycetales bacterium]
MRASTPEAPSLVTLGSVGNQRRPDVQGLRAIAVLAVVAFHAGLPVPGGFTGVDIFFVISGYVITALILREHSLGRWSAALFYARRAKRLLPALALMTLVVLLLSFLLESPYGPQQVTAETGIGAMLLAANIVIARTVGGYFDPAAESNPLLHTWSLSVEEQFYLVFPLVILGGIALSVWRRRSGSAVGPLIAVALLTAVSFLLSLVLTFGWSLFGWSPLALTNQPATWAFYSSPTRAWEFGVGALIAIAAGWLARQAALRPASAKPVRQVLAWGGSAVVIVGLFAITDATSFPGFAALLPVLGTAAIIAAGHLRASTDVAATDNVTKVDSTAVNRFLASSPMVRIGDGSYSIYLWHWPIILFALLLFQGPWTAPLAALFSFLPAWLAYRFVEQPIRNAPMPRLRIVLALGLATSGTVIIAALVLLLVGPRTAAYAQDQRVPTLGVETGCLLVDAQFNADDLSRCTFPSAADKGLIVLAGDSHADSLSTGVVAAGNALG